MKVEIVAGTAQPELGQAVAHSLGLDPIGVSATRFPDGEVEMRLGRPLGGRAMFIVQPTSPPVGEHLMELLLIADACARAGAAAISAVIPYFGYARQDRRQGGRSLGALIAARVLENAPFGRIVAVDLHSRAMEGYLGARVEHVTAVPLLAEAIRPHLAADPIIVAPDFGAMELAERYAAALELPVAVIHKARVSGAEVAVRRLLGDVRGKSPVIVDDMISTGETVAAAARALAEAGAGPDLLVAATHGPLVGGALAVLHAASVRRLFTTDSVRTSVPPSAAAFPHQIVGLAPLLGDTIRHLAGGLEGPGLER
jgi:ribose-phosphate pyrophosphokinase